MSLIELGSGSYICDVPKRWGDSDELERARLARHARLQLDRIDLYLGYLKRAARLALDLRLPHDPLTQQLITAAEGLRARFAAQSGMVNSSRRRATPCNSDPTMDALIFLDECGSHSGMAPDTFPVFTLTAVAVGRNQYEELDRSWRTWKATHLGSAEASVHEPEVRKREGLFAGDAGDALVEKLNGYLAAARFCVVACAVNRPAFRVLPAPDPLESTLPDHMYLFAMDVLFERLVLMLDRDFRGGRAEVVAESRGPREDALLQYEFARLHLDGTSFIGDGFFRTRLHPGISFKGKEQNCTGLQLADLAARPIAEKVVNPESSPERWAAIREKLCPGKETKNSILGLKVFPWDARYEDLYKS